MSTPTVESIVNAVAKAAVLTKIGHCVRNGATDIAPMLHVFYDDGSDQLAVIVGDQREAIPGLMASMRPKGRREAFVALVSEAYRTKVAPEDFGATQRGDAQRAYEAGSADADLILTVVVLSAATGGSANVVLPYAYEDAMPIFGEPEASIGAHGVIVELLRRSMLDPTNN